MVHNNNYNQTYVMGICLCLSILLWDISSIFPEFGINKRDQDLKYCKVSSLVAIFSCFFSITKCAFNEPSFQHILIKLLSLIFVR